MKALLILLLLILSASFSLTAQLERLPVTKEYKIRRKTIDEFRTHKFVDGGFVVNGNLKYSEIEGTPYLKSEFKKGTIITSAVTLIDNLLLRYNCYSDQIEYLKMDSILEITPKSLVSKAEFDNRTFSCVKFRNSKKLVEGFCEVIVKGKASLFCKYNVDFLPPAPGLPYGDSNKAHFKPIMKSFYVSNGDTYVDFVGNKIDLINILKDRKTELNNFISKYKLLAKKGDDLVRIIEYYNSL
ncbi:MAG: hypothetical protein WCP85_10370 [Mariniphaga sp.]